MKRLIISVGILFVAASLVAACAKQDCLALGKDLSIQEIDKRIRDAYDLDAYHLVSYVFSYDASTEDLVPETWWYRAVGAEGNSRKTINPVPASHDARCIATQIDEGKAAAFLEFNTPAFAVMEQQFPLIQDRPIDIVLKYDDRYSDARSKEYWLIFDKDRERYIWRVDYYRKTVRILLIDALSGAVISEFDPTSQ